MNTFEMRVRLVHLEIAMTGEFPWPHDNQDLRVHFTSPKYKDADIGFSSFRHLSQDELLDLTYTLCFLLGEEVMLEYVEDGDEWLLHGISPVRDFSHRVRHARWYSEEYSCS
jgi:hypothetical protein